MMKRVSLLLVLVAQWGLSCCLAAAQDAVPVGTDLSKSPEPSPTRDIGSRRELFDDRFLIDRLDNTQLKLHEPISGGVAIRIDKPWEGPVNFGGSVLYHRSRYHLYYRGIELPGERSVLCVAVSQDGVNWTKPAPRAGRPQRTDRHQHRSLGLRQGRFRVCQRALGGHAARRARVRTHQGDDQRAAERRAPHILARPGGTQTAGLLGLGGRFHVPQARSAAGDDQQTAQLFRRRQYGVLE